MKKLCYIVFFLLVMQSCDSSGSVKRHENDKLDTNFLKRVKWENLNSYVSYHTITSGIHSTDTNLQFTMKLIASFSFNDSSFVISNDSLVIYSSNELKNVILSDSFSSRKGLDCIMKINSQITFALRPDLLETIFVRVKDTNDVKIEELKDSLRKLRFVQDINIMNNSLPNRGFQTTLLKIKVNDNYRNLNDIKSACSMLEQRSDIESVFINDLFSGINEQDLFYRLTSE